MLKNRAAIDYLCGEKLGMSNSLRERKPSWQDWEVVQMTTSTLKRFVGFVVLSHARTDKWLLSDAMDNLITVYIDCVEGSETVIKIKHEYSEDSCIFARNLEEMSKKMCFALKQNLLSRFWT